MISKLYILVVVFIIVFFTSCEKVEEYSIVPELKYKDFYLTPGEPGASIATGNLVLSFIDGDGDIGNYPPPALKGKYVKVKYVTQLPMHYPAFVFFCNLPQYVKEPYMRYLENKLRDKFEFTGTPVQIFMRKK